MPKFAPVTLTVLGEQSWSKVDFIPLYQFDSGKYGPENIQIRTLFMKCFLKPYKISLWMFGKVLFKVKIRNFRCMNHHKLRVQNIDI